MEIKNGNISILEQNTEQFEAPQLMNAFIQSTQTDWLGFVDRDVTSKEEIHQIIEENSFLLDYDVVLFGNDIPEGECNCIGLLEHPQAVIYGFVFQRRLLSQAGACNRLLTGNNAYEFLLRLAEVGNVYSIPCIADKCVECNPDTMAYIFRRYIGKLQQNGKRNDVLLKFVQAASKSGVQEEFQRSMQRFLKDSEEYARIERETAPWLILVCDDICYGVLAHFAKALAKELTVLGQAVLETNYISMEMLACQNYKAIIGFQTPVLEEQMVRETKARRYQFWFDNPIVRPNLLKKTSKETYVLCQDGDYARFFTEHCDVKNAIHFPPAGDYVKEKELDRIYDLVFVGSYSATRQLECKDSFQLEFYQYMSEHMDCTVEQGIRAVWQMQGIEYDEQYFMNIVDEIQEVYNCLLQSYRHKIIEAILSAGIQMHVFGDSWKNYQGDGAWNLIIHPQVIGEEALQVWQQAKIGLNIMSRHTAGMTERIANIMLCGACCLSDETAYLREHFEENREIVLYKADRLDELIEKICYLLQHKERRERIALNGRNKAVLEHTWHKRAIQLLELVEQDTNNGSRQITKIG